ncbi:hypothetical protein J9303_08090 [Bacillaceae bacterium Marseille-Q3522]|nr:hypothetical protein [Bacillaceae bacterium Marseille-Q3522]
MDIVNLIGSFLGGCLGALVGGNPSFVIVGIIGVLFHVMGDAAGAPILQKTVEFTLFTPCISFAGAVASLAYAANIRKYNLSGTDLNKALGFSKDIKVVLIGGFFGAFGFLGYYLGLYLHLPLDVGALMVLLSGVIVRFFFGNRIFINPKLQDVSLFQKGCMKEWLFKILVGFVTAGVAAYAVYLNGSATIGFYISALSLLFFLLDSDFPVTHHITLIAGYATIRSGDVMLGILFGVLASIVFELYQNIINTNVDSHIDAPACTIATLSLVIFLIFP